MRGDGRVPAMFKHLRHLKANGTDETTARFLMWRFNLDRCDPPRWAPTREVIFGDSADAGMAPLFLNWFRRAWNQADRLNFNAPEAALVDFAL